MTKTYHQPLGGNKMPRFGGLASMMRLPVAASAAGLNAGFIGVPLDIGTSHRPGARFGPRQIRAESCLIRPYNMATGAAPFDTLQVADLGDVPINTYNLLKSVDIIEGHYRPIIDAGCIPLTLGGDHTIALPILRAMKARHGPVALIHVDAHADVNPDMFGERIAHGTPFRRAVEEGLLIGDKVWQIGLRGSGYSAEDFDWPRQQGFTIVPAQEKLFGLPAHQVAQLPLDEQFRHLVEGESPDMAWDKCCAYAELLDDTPYADAIIEAARQCRFRPARRRGRPVPVNTILQFNLATDR